MPELSWIVVATVLALVFVAGVAWTSGCAIAAWFWGKVLK